MSSYACAEAVKDVIESNWAGSNISISSVPAGFKPPYVLLHPQDATDIGGSMADPVEWATFYVLVKSIGSTAEQCNAVRYRVRELLLKMDGSGYSYPMTPSDGTDIEWRTLRTFSAIVESGRDLYEANDIYGFRKAF